MKTLFIDNGMEEYQLTEGGALLRFNPKDPNLYARFIKALDKINAVVAKQGAKARAVGGNNKDAGAQIVLITQETDAEVKAVLNEVFGNDNNFDEILRGVSLMAVGSNGKRVVTNLMDALLPVMEAGAKTYVQEEVHEAKAARKARQGNQ